VTAIVLSDGTEVRPDDVEHAEYYPKDAFSQFGCHFGGPDVRECPFLALKLRERVVRITGSGAENDAQKLEQAGVIIKRFIA
jgi:hypothetical protein